MKMNDNLRGQLKFFINQRVVYLNGLPQYVQSPSRLLLLLLHHAEVAAR